MKGREEIELRDKAKAFVEKEIAPHVATMDRENKYPFELLKKLGQNDYIGVRFPREYWGK